MRRLALAILVGVSSAVHVEGWITSVKQGWLHRAVVSEISKLFRMIDPHRRLERLKPISMPEQETAISKATAAVADATAPVRERLGVYWHQFSAIVGKGGNADGGDQDDDVDASFVVR